MASSPPNPLVVICTCLVAMSILNSAANSWCEDAEWCNTIMMVASLVVSIATVIFLGSTY